MNELGFWLVIRRCPGFGPRRFAALLEQEKSLSNCFSGLRPRPDFLSWLGRVGIKQFEPDWKSVEQDLHWATSEAHHILTWQDALYPTFLKEIASAPPLLFVAGKKDVLRHDQIALVGSRHPTSQGKENAYHFAFELVKQGLAITSGLALGIDAASHEGALAAQGVTLAVLGHGLDQVYPTRHKPLAQAIMERGALVSEFPLGTPPLAQHFPQRNRIISGLSKGVLVVESGMKSGSLITAKCALDEGREVFALPGSIHNPMAKGCNQLIREGAKCVESVAHILEEFSFRGEMVQSSLDIVEDIPAEQRVCLEHVGREGCTPMDSVVAKTGLTVEEVSSMLLELELQGRIASIPGGFVRLTTGG